MKRQLCVLTFLLLLALPLSGSAWAQSSAGYDLSWHVLSSGGAQGITQPGYRLHGTLSQTAIGPVQGPGNDLDAGYWYGIRREVQPVEYRVYLPLVIR